MTPQNVILAEELSECDGPISFCLNHFGKRIVGCSSQATYNLFSVLKLLPPRDERMDFMMTVQAGIKESLGSVQSANTENVIKFLSGFQDIVDRADGGDFTKDISAKEVLLKLRSQVAILISAGVAAAKDQGHMGCLFIENGMVYLDGTELTPDLFCAYLYSSKQNCIWWFRR